LLFIIHSFESIARNISIVLKKKSWKKTDKYCRRKFFSHSFFSHSFFSHSFF